MTRALFAFPTSFRSVPWVAYTLGQLTVTNIGFYAAMSVLAVHLAQGLSFTPPQVATILFASSLGLRVSRFVVAPWMDRLPVRTSLLLALGVAMIGYLGLYAFSSFPAVLASVFLVGTGYGSNGLLVTTLSSFAPNERKRNIYAFQYSLATSAAAIGPAIVSWCIAPMGTHAPFLFSALMLCFSALIVLSLREAELPKLHAPERFYKRVRNLLSKRQTYGMLLSVAMCWFLYTQKFAILPLFLNGALGQPGWMGAAMLLFSLTIMLTAIPLTGWFERRGAGPCALLLLSFIFYAAGYLAVGFFPVPPVIFASIILWAVAEGLGCPALNGMISIATKPEERLAGFSLAALPTALGEFLGMSLGVEGYRMATETPSNVFLALGGLGLACAAVQYILNRKVTSI